MTYRLKKLIFCLAWIWGLWLWAGTTPQSTYALCDELTGPKIAGNTGTNWLEAVRRDYDQTNSNCPNQVIPVTVIWFDQNRGEIGNILTGMKNRNLWPIIRIASENNGGYWRTITPNVARALATTLVQAVNTSGAIKRPIVYFGNEPNLTEEWGDGNTVEARLESYTQSLKAFAEKSQALGAPYDIYLPPMALHQSQDLSTEQGWLRSIIIPQVKFLVQGAALTIYNTSSDAINSDYLSMKSFYQREGIYNLIVSEVGVLKNSGPLQEPCYLTEWKQVMGELFSQQPGTNILPGAKAVNTSFFEDVDCDGAPDATHLVVIDYEGQVEVKVVAGDVTVPLEQQLIYENKESRLYTCCDLRNEDFLPGNRQTVWGTSAFGRNIPCQTILPTDQKPWGDKDSYFEDFCPANSTDTGSCGFPVDYSPRRPFPGDSGKYFYDQAGNWENDFNKCYDLADENIITPAEITTYCNPAPEATDIIHWFPGATRDDADTNDSGTPDSWSIESRLETIWADEYKASQIPFLGNSPTSPRQFSQFSQRMSYFLTDFLRGEPYWDGQRVHYSFTSDFFDDPLDFSQIDDRRRVLEESGPIRKLYPRKVLQDDTRKAQFIRCRFLGEDRRFCEPGYEGVLGVGRSRLISNDPIHDYALTWTKNTLPLLNLYMARSVSEEKFTELPDRRHPEGTANEFPEAIRLSTWANKVKALPWPLRSIPTGWWAQFKYHGLWEYYFPLTSREDTTGIVNLSLPFPCPPEGEETPWPDFTEFLQEVTVPSSLPIKKLYDAYENEASRGYYYLRLFEREGVPQVWDDDETDPDPPPLCEIHLVKMLSIPYIPEAYELSQWAGRPLTPNDQEDRDSENYWKKPPSLGTLNLDNPFSHYLKCDAGDSVRGGPGDIISAAANSTDVIATDQNDLPVIRLNQGLQMPVRWTDWVARPADSESKPKWVCGGEEDPGHWPERETKTGTRTGWITTHIPYLKQLARRTIGPAGFIKGMLPSEFSDNINSAIKEVTKGRLMWYELPGYGPGEYSYTNNLVRGDDPQKHWGCCDDSEPASCMEDKCGGRGLITRWENTSCETAEDNDHFSGTWYCCEPDGGPCYDAEEQKVRVENSLCRQATDTCVCLGNQCVDLLTCGDQKTGECGQLETDSEGNQLGGDAPCCRTNWTDYRCLHCHPNSEDKNCGPVKTRERDDDYPEDLKIVRGQAEINQEDARFYYPYIGAIDIYRQYLLNMVNPYEKTIFYNPYSGE
ncbi:hypothetical protein ACFLZP_00220 [Patescibacteria group bacterium]